MATLGESAGLEIERRSYEPSAARDAAGARLIYFRLR